MATADFSEVIKLINLSRIAQIAEKPVLAMPEQWALYKGTYRVHTTSVPFEVLYLHASITAEGVRAANRDAFNDLVPEKRTP